MVPCPSCGSTMPRIRTVPPGRLAAWFLLSFVCIGLPLMVIDVCLTAWLGRCQTCGRS